MNTLPREFEVFRKIWLVDTEYGHTPGNRVRPVCVVGRELRSGEVVRHWSDNLPVTNPFGREGELVVAYAANAECSFFLAAGWELPHRILDLFAEYALLRCGDSKLRSLLDALKYFDLPVRNSAYKNAMQQLVTTRDTYTDQEREDILRYCEEDTNDLEPLLYALVAAFGTNFNLGYALIRGAYIKSVAVMEYSGIPIDMPLYEKLKARWPTLLLEVIEEVDKAFGVYEGSTFKMVRFEEYVKRERLPWPRLPSGQCSLDEDTFKEMALSHPQVAPLKELRSTLTQMRNIVIEVGTDGRNRCYISPFGARTGRNTPSTTKSVFGPAKWVRSLIKPEPGTGICYLDYEQQEFGIAAALSGDARMQEAYLSGDSYLAFAKMAGAIPEEATKATYPNERNIYKTIVLAVSYGMGVQSMARKLGLSVGAAGILLRQHKEIFATYWKWVIGRADQAIYQGFIETVHGWRMKVGVLSRITQLQNFPMQANAANMLWCACILAQEAGIKICWPVHDAILIEAPLDRLGEEIQAAKEAMTQASKIVLDGFEIRVEEKTVEYPERFIDPAGADFWAMVESKLCVS
jgi:DNA polymerase I-like protein with 3'-5' exonuclease and polymerase domains